MEPNKKFNSCVIKKAASNRKQPFDYVIKPQLISGILLSSQIRIHIGFINRYRKYSSEVGTVKALRFFNQ